MSYEGSCHCGAVTFEVAGDIPGTAIACNCSHCRRKGFLLTFVDPDAFTLKSGADSLTEYRFAKKGIAHLTCKVCGVQGHGTGTGPSGKAMVAVNLRAVPACDLDSLEIHRHDGANY